NNSTINSSIYSSPFYPTYDKFGRIVAGNTLEYGKDFNHLNYPSCVYLDSKKNIYICDTENNRIMKYSRDNPTNGTIIVDAFSAISSPKDLYIDQKTDDVYILDRSELNCYRVLYLLKNPTQTKVIIILNGNRCEALSIDFDNHRNIYVSETENHRIVKWLSPNYDEFIVVAGNGKPGKLLHQLTSPRGIYINKINNDLYIADYKRIQLWTSGSTIGKTIVRTSFFSPYDIKQDRYSNLYVTDDVSHTIQLFSQSIEATGLEGITIFGIPKKRTYKDGLINATDYLYGPKGLYLDDTNGDLYVADSNFHRILKISINGQFIPGKKINSSLYSCDLPMNITWQTNNAIVIVNFTNKYFSVEELYIDKKNNFFFIDKYNNKIQKYSSWGIINIISQGLMEPKSIYVDSSTDDIYILDMNSNSMENIYRVQLWQQNSANGIVLINGTGKSNSMIVDQNLNIYISEYDNNRIKKWLKHTNYTISITVIGNGWDYYGNYLLSNLDKFYLDEKNEIIYIVNFKKSHIIKWRLGNEKRTGEIIYSNQILSSVLGVTFDCNMNIYFFNSSSDGIYQINILTNQIRKIVTWTANYNIQSKSIQGFKFDSFGNLYLHIMERFYWNHFENNRIIKYSIIR
ncbi:unnamed protein product, partial [Rotaria sp. Silwood1]